MTSRNSLFNSNSHSNSSTNSINHNIKPQKKCLTYILDNSLESNDSTGYHSIGVNSLIYNNYDKSLISGGRDGQISIWNCSSTSSRGNYCYTSSDIYDSFNNGEKIKNFINKNLENESEILNLEVSIRKGLKSEAILEKDKNFKLFKSSNLHLDWISDLSLINASTVASCSNDLSIKLWNYNLNQITILGTHKDYIKKINFNKKFNNELISAGLDKTIKLWDLTKKCVISNYTSSDERGSIYSIDSFNNMIISGGPTNSVTLFDRRALNRPIKHFIGHTDNIRSLILKENLFLSGSSDTSIKLWDLRTTRILRNFDMHDSPVWSLFTESANDGHEDNDFSTFYSGDKSGLLLKTDLTASDLSMTNNSSNNNKNKQYGNNNNYNYFNHKINESLGVSTIIANINSPISGDFNSISSLSGINSIAVSSDSSLVWTATSSSISKLDTNFISSWSIPQTSKLAIYQGVKLNRNLIALNNNNNNNNNNLTISNSHKYSFDNSNKNSIEVVRSAEDSSIKDTFDLMSQLSSDDLNQIDNALISKNQIFNDYFESSNQALDKAQNEIEKDTENNADDDDYGNDLDNNDETNETCFVNLNGGPNQEFLITNEMNDTGTYKDASDVNDDYDDDDEKETSIMQTRSIKSNDSELDPFNHNFKESFDPFNNQKLQYQDSGNENERSENFTVINKPIIINYDDIKDNLINLVPFNLKPVQDIKGKNGLIKSKILNNRRNVIAMDQTGSIYIFDILTCLLIKKIETDLSTNSIETDETHSNSNLKDDLNSMGHKLLHISDKFESICNEFQTDETLPNWCSVETKAGKLFITLEENKFTSCEIYSDEFFENYPFIKHIDADLNNPDNELLRFNIGKIVLKSFFNSFVEIFLSEINNVSDANSKSLNRLSMLSLNSDSEKYLNTLPNKPINEKDKEREKEKDNKSNSKRNKFLGRFKSKDNSTTTKKSSTHTKSDFSSNTMDNSMNSAPTIESNLEFLTYLKTHSELIINSGNEPIFDYSNASNVLILVNEEVSHNNLIKISLKKLISPTSSLINHLQLQLPIWIMNCLFLNKYSINNNSSASKITSNSNKIGFILIPDKSNCQELKGIDNTKLTATSMVRVKKILEFVKEKLDDESQKHWKFELICKDKVLEDRMTLGTIKARVWKRGGDVEFYYKVISM